MGSEVLNPFNAILDGFLSYFPSLLAGIGLVLLGWLCGWILKRLVIQLAVVLRIDRILSRSRWKEQYGKADVRHGLFALVGNAAFGLVLLIFIDNAFIAWKLTLLSDLLGKAILFFPRFAIAAAIFSAGWFASSLAQRHVMRVLRDEGIPKAALIARFARMVLLLVFSAMAMVELEFAREIVVIGFASIIVTLGAIAVLAFVKFGSGPEFRRDAAPDRSNGEEGEGRSRS